MAKEDGSAASVSVGFVGEQRATITAEFWHDGRVRLIDGQGMTIVAGTIEHDRRRPGGSAFAPADPSIFADVDRPQADEADRIGPVKSTRDPNEY